MRRDRICYECKLAIEDDMVTLPTGQNYHPNHLICDVCKEDISESDAVFTHKAQLFCRYHYSMLKAYRCFGCEQALLGEFLENDEERWHSSCFILYKVRIVFMGSRWD